MGDFLTSFFLRTTRLRVGFFFFGCSTLSFGVWFLISDLEPRFLRPAVSFRCSRVMTDDAFVLVDKRLADGFLVFGPAAFDF